jgi:carbamoyltransferase
MSSIYGFFGGSHDPAVALIVDGEIKFCIEEERITRIKSGDNYLAVPNLSTTVIQRISNLSVQEANYLAVADHSAKRFMSSWQKPYTNFNHHQCHAASAYYTSGFKEKTLVVTLDGGGNNDTCHVYLAENGKMERVLKIPYPTQGTLGLLWAYSTMSCRGTKENGEFVWKLCKDEGKLMGMAPDGIYDERYYNQLKKCLDYKDLNFFPSNTIGRTIYVVEKMREAGWLDTDEKLASFANSLQKLTEEVILNFFADLHNLYPDYNHVALAGGFFANVKANQKINQLEWVKEMFVFPAMGDSGLALGSAILKCRQIGEGFETPERIKNVSWGRSYTNEEIWDESLKFSFKSKNYIQSHIVDDLISGKLIGWFQDGFEFGPRSLGSRSILAQATDYQTHFELNKRLKRDDRMPFAPMVLDEEFENVFVENKSRYAAEFMTICFDVREEWKDKIPAVIQKSDGTARPQLVTKESQPKVWNLLKGYHEKTGIPAILNTSFNSHNSPIIDSPAQAFQMLEEEKIDILVIGNYAFYK